MFTCFAHMTKADNYLVNNNNTTSHKQVNIPIRYRDTPTETEKMHLEGTRRSHTRTATGTNVY